MQNNQDSIISKNTETGITTMTLSPFAATAGIVSFALGWAGVGFLLAVLKDKMSLGAVPVITSTTTIPASVPAVPVTNVDTTVVTLKEEVKEIIPQVHEEKSTLISKSKEQYVETN